MMLLIKPMMKAVVVHQNFGVGFDCELWKDDFPYRY